MQKPSDAYSTLLSFRMLCVSFEPRYRDDARIDIIHPSLPQQAKQILAVPKGRRLPPSQRRGFLVSGLMRFAYASLPAVSMLADAGAGVLVANVDGRPKCVAGAGGK